MANGEATTVYNLCNNSVGEASGVSGWGDRDQLSRISSDLNSKSTQTRGSPTCQTERVIRAHCSIGEPGEQLVTLPSHTTYPVSSCASCSFEWVGRWSCSDLVQDTAKAAARLNARPKSPAEISASWRGHSRLTPARVGPLLLLLERLHHDPEKRRAPISSTLRVEGNWPRQRQ